MVGAEHLLPALLAHEAAWRVKVPPPCRDELRAFVEQQLDRLPATNAYRDAAVPALAKDLVDALRPSRWTLFERPLGPRDLMLRLAMIPRVRDWISWATMDDLLVDDAIVEATTLATDRGHQAVTVEHFLRVIADQRWLAAPRRLAEHLDALFLGSEYTGTGAEPRLSEHLAVLAAQTKVYARIAKRAPTSDMLLAIALREDEVRACFEAASIEPNGLLQLLAHGTQDWPADPETGRVDVVFHNDDFTPLEVVQEILSEHLELSAPEMKRRIEAVHDDGAAVVTSRPVEEALPRVAAARDKAQRLHFPLRITLRAAG